MTRHCHLTLILTIHSPACRGFFMMGCSPSTIEEHARNRVLPGLRMGHEWRFPREAFMKAINTLAITGELHRTTKKRAVQAVASTKVMGFREASRTDQQRHPHR